MVSCDGVRRRLESVGLRTGAVQRFGSDLELSAAFAPCLRFAGGRMAKAGEDPSRGRAFRPGSRLTAAQAASRADQFKPGSSL